MVQEKISIVIITYNRSKELERAVMSCILNSEDIGKEIIIIDNASTDDTRRLCEGLVNEYPNICKYFGMETNLGVDGGRKLGFKLATNNIVFFLDDDAIIVTENFFEKLLDIFNKNSECMCLAPQIYQPIDGTHLQGEIFVNKDRQKEMFSFIGAAHAFRKKFWENKELYPENLMFGSEELYASLNIRKNNKRILFAEELLVHHLPSFINRQKGTERAYNINLNIYLIRKMYYPICVHPILTVLFILRSIKNKCLFIDRLKEDIKKRYQKRYFNRMNMKEFLGMCQILPVRKLF